MANPNNGDSAGASAVVPAARVAGTAGRLRLLRRLFDRPPVTAR
jgi:hypothetical protein